MEHPKRWIGEYDRGLPGPTVVVIGAIHGNEPAGVHAMRRVLEALDEARLPLCGRVVGLIGNLAALESGQRFITRDLNRMWTDGEIARLRARDPHKDLGEEVEMRDLLLAIEGEIARTRGPIIVLDLHSTSAPGAPFSIVEDTLGVRNIAFQLPIPALFGLEEAIGGVLVGWLVEQGHIGIAVEGGQHTAETTAPNLEAIIWATLVAAKSLPCEEVPDAAAQLAALATSAAGMPGAIEVVYRHAITEQDDFRMKPGFSHFQHVWKGKQLAVDLSGDVRATHDGFILMPLYQGVGEEGFFIGREYPRWWLRFSEWVRKRGFESLLTSLPGVSPHHGRPHAVQVRKDNVPQLVFNLLRLFGYRKRGVLEDAWLFMRRPTLPAEED